MGQGTDDYISVMFWITIWLQDVFEGFLPRELLGGGLHSLSAFLVVSCHES